MLAKTLKSDLPLVNGPILVNRLGVPRFWPAVWMSFLPGDLAESTIKKKLRQVERFYQHVDEMVGFGELDLALAEVDLDRLCGALEGYFLSLRSGPLLSASEERWQTALHFVLDVVQRITRAATNQPQIETLTGRLRKIELLNARLHVGRRRRPIQIRSLPSEVLEALYEMLNPESPTNPFRGAHSRWRVYIVFMLLLHQGLRIGELLNFPSDVIKSGFDRNRQDTRVLDGSEIQHL